MANLYTDVSQSGSSTPFVFGLSASDLSTFSVSGFYPRGITTKENSPEVFVTAVNGEGHVEAIAISKTANKMISVTVIGYIDSTFNPFTIGNSFTMFGRFFLIKSVSDPRVKGEFVEISLSAESHPLVTS
jgi:hypothetical protein